MIKEVWRHLHRLVRTDMVVVGLTLLLSHGGDVSAVLPLSPAMIAISNVFMTCLLLSATKSWFVRCLILNMSPSLSVSPSPSQLISSDADGAIQRAGRFRVENGSSDEVHTI